MFRKIGRKYFSILGIIAVLFGMLAVAGAQSRIAEQAASNDGAPRMMGAVGAPSAQQGPVVDVPVQAYENGIVRGQSVKNDVSRPLRDIPAVPAEKWTTIRAMPEHDVLNNSKAPQVKDPVVQTSTGAGEAAATDAMPAITSFAGLTNRNGVYPPDTSGEVGPNHFVQWVNLSFQIFNKSGASVYGPANGNTIWAGFGGACDTQNSGDPVVLYDQYANRWLMSQFTSSKPYGECIAISTTGDPTGSYYRYFFQHSTTIFYDYPHIGIWPDGYYATFNKFKMPAGIYQGAAVVAYDRAAMLNGQAATFQEKAVSSSYGTLQPADMDGPASFGPPAGSAHISVSRSGTTGLNFWKYAVNWTSPASSSFTGPTTVGVASYNQLCSGTRSCVKQPGTTVGLDGLGDRLMFRVTYRNFGTHQSLVVNHSVNALASGTQAGVRWYEIRNPHGTPTVYQQSTYAPADGTSRWMASAAQDKQGNIAVGYSASSTSVYPSIRLAGRLAGDPLNTLAQGETSVVAGSGSQTGTGYRWGDYSQMSVDPVDDCTFWYTTKYLVSTGTAPWITRIANFKFPGCL